MSVDVHVLVLMDSCPCESSLLGIWFQCLLLETGVSWSSCVCMNNYVRCSLILMESLSLGVLTALDISSLVPWDRSSGSTLCATTYWISVWGSFVTFFVISSPCLCKRVVSDSRFSIIFVVWGCCWSPFSYFEYVFSPPYSIRPSRDFSWSHQIWIRFYDCNIPNIVALYCFFVSFVYGLV